MSTENSVRESIPIALIREAIENTLGIPGFDNLVSLSITSMAHDGRGANGQVNVIRFGKHGMYGETYAIDRSTVTCPQCHQAIGRPHTDYCPLRIREEVFAGITTDGGGTVWPEALAALAPGSQIRADVCRWPLAKGWPTTPTSDLLLERDSQGAWGVPPGESGWPFTVPPVTECLASIRILSIVRTGKAAPVENAEYPGQPGERVDSREQLGDNPESLTAQLDEATTFVDNGCRCPNPERHTPGCPALPHTFIETADYDANNTAAGPNEPYCWTCGAGTDDPRHATC